MKAVRERLAHRVPSTTMRFEKEPCLFDFGFGLGGDFGLAGRFLS